MQIDKAEDLRCRYERRQAEIQALALLWKSLLPEEFLPAGRQFSIWIDRYGFELTEKGVRQTAIKFSILESKAKRERDDSIAMSQDYCVRYASAVMVKCAAQRQEAANAPKRVLDGEALWRSKKLRQVQPVKFRAEYANLLPLALSTGSFECDADTIWTDVYAFNRPDVTPEDVAAILDAFEQARLLFRWTAKQDGKVWGYWVGIDKEGRLPTGGVYAHAKKGLFPPPVEYREFAGVDRIERSVNVQGTVDERTGKGSGSGLGHGTGIGLGFGLGVGVPTSTSSNPNSETNERGSNSSTLNSTTSTPTNPQLDEVVEAMVTRYPRVCRPGLESDWRLAFRKGITKLANELFGGKENQAIPFVSRKLDDFIVKSKSSENIYAPVKFFSEWMESDYDVKALRKKKRMDDEF